MPEAAEPGRLTPSPHAARLRTSSILFMMPSRGGKARCFRLLGKGRRETATEAWFHYRGEVTITLRSFRQII